MMSGASSRRGFKSSRVVAPIKSRSHSPFSGCPRLGERTALGLARAGGYDGGVEQNPYQSPQATDERPFIPAWRRAVSIFLIVFGFIYSLALPSFAIESAVTGKFNIGRILIASLISTVAGSALWFGIRLRRRR
jgi:hypothetical protein